MILTKLQRCGVYRIRYTETPNELYCYQLSDTIRLQTIVLRDDQTASIRTRANSPILTLNEEWLTIHSLYRWDGATGLPLIRKLIFPSLIHDALCQVVESGQTLLTYADVDEEFYYWLRKAGYRTLKAHLLFWCVRTLGPIYRSFIK